MDCALKQMNKNMIQMTVMLSEIKQCLMQLKKKAIMIFKCVVESFVFRKEQIEQIYRECYNQTSQRTTYDF